jgi:hypothetical protein
MGAHAHTGRGADDLTGKVGRVMNEAATSERVDQVGRKEVSAQPERTRRSRKDGLPDLDGTQEIAIQEAVALFGTGRSTP